MARKRSQEPQKHYVAKMQVRLPTGAVKRILLLVSANTWGQAQTKAKEMIAQLGGSVSKIDYGGIWVRAKVLLC